MSMLKSSHPYQSGFLMPPEWAPHKGTWASWPFDQDIWHGFLHEVRAEHAALLRTISHFEEVHLLCCDEECENSARTLLSDCPKIYYYKVPLDDVWFRDNGPLFIKQKNNLAATKWLFNAWGKKFEFSKDNNASYEILKPLNIPIFEPDIVMEGGSIDINSNGFALTTRQCLRNENRNPQLQESDLEKYLQDYLGVRKVLWLEGGLEGDHTDGHIDTIVRFVDDHTILSSVCEDISDPNYETMANNLEVLRSFRDENDQPFRIELLPLPIERKYFQGERIPSSYANFYIGNGFVVVPQYGDPNDEKALAVISRLFPSRKVIGLSSKFIILGGGSFHCLTQQQPL